MTNILTSVFPPEGIAFAVLSLSLTGALGLFLGGIKILKINFGIAGVLFAGIILSYLGLHPSEKILEFVREFGLILFVYAVGTQVGPGFFSSFKKDGLKLNVMATGIILFGIALTILIAKLFSIGMPSAIGMYTGAVTNTPALAAAQQTIINTQSADRVNDISVGYALAYPGAIMAIILTLILLRVIFRKEAEADMESLLKTPASSNIENYSIRVENKNLDSMKIKDIPAIDSFNIVVSRICKGNSVSVAHEEDSISIGDIILAVGTRENLEQFMKIVGSPAETDLRRISSKIIHSRVIVSRKNVIGKTLAESGIYSHNVIATRVSRADVEFIINDDYLIQYGDNIVLVGDESDIKKASALLGNSPKDLNHPQLIPVFIGIIAGIIIGSIPLSIPGFSQPLKLGLAGGPLIAAIFFSYRQSIGPISWYMPPAGNLMLREIGIVLFLASVGLKSGESFFSMLIYGEGLKIAALAFLISFIPVMAIGTFMKIKYRINYLSLCGALSGSMTDPPALAFSNSLSPSNAASMSYASVYPWVMFLRIISAQILVLFFPG
ncbi:MAG: putative transporter [Elusimicrobiota bacterium]